MTTVIPVPALLGASRDTVRPALEAAVERLDATSRALSSYHLGWTDAQGRPEPGNGGKAVRPALALLSAGAAGAPAEVGLPGAVAVELVHNFSLLHDDLMDGDVERRHRRTVWAQWGAPSAILTGDALLNLAQQVLLEVPGAQGPAAARLLADAVQDLVRGQVEDLAFERRAVVSVEECFAMAGGKTAALLSASAAVGAVLAGGPAGTVAGLAGYGWELGLAFQLVDDVLGIWGEPSVTGKPVLSDLRARKKSLPVTWVVSQGGPPGRQLSAWLGSSGDDDEVALRQVADLLETAGARDWARSEAAARMAAAERSLDSADAPPDVHAELVELGRFLAGREC
jgi:geranylgeranyl diphosphate synthase type I